MAQNINNQNPQDFHTFMNYPQPPNTPGIIVPQRVYRRATGQNGFNPLPPIRFFANGFLGLHLESALVPGNELDNAETTPPLSETNIRPHAYLISQWPGYDEWTMLNALTANLGNRPVTLAQIANQAATRVQQFYNDMLHATGGDPHWALQNIPFRALSLVELRNVSQGSWQPVLCHSPT
ncbi:uncharacterized protein PHACADRAFT_198745 [Phanerochaete carnosa HHB-10118-sp]|uniref:Uncharacterized protein n=1 Tax=Phanerochaete carnosa (strain HHB-10118-sp) TaxID=650164 RepID=K5US24_PHACS|nr:uncharacterized protein PHACADRAFT_198745 [Phanerochaete carnosa HHB-10118-sp]EKM52701.1 hypothetical protein PHACADRAFT_198745 [Phanerochaete carnosa HHB-10118-sp]